MEDGEDFSYCDSNRFRLVILASQRAHELSSGAMTFVARQDSKNTVVALRELAEGQLNVSDVFGLAVQRCRKYFEEFANPRNAASSIRASSRSPHSADGKKVAYSAFLDQDKFLSGKGSDIDGF
ncbi:DNA-directed RNA polymerase subunit omega [Anaplasma bovis]|uniref:DNA-directed RNA polymerase subunit omega n=1 Tax=Anaplasma bovis TaxID=186733 RepID=UPI002FF168C5